MRGKLQGEQCGQGHGVALHASGHVLPRCPLLCRCACGKPATCLLLRPAAVHYLANLGLPCSLAGPGVHLFHSFHFSLSFYTCARQAQQAQLGTYRSNQLSPNQTTRHHTKHNPFCTSLHTLTTWACLSKGLATQPMPDLALPWPCLCAASTTMMLFHV